MKFDAVWAEIQSKLRPGTEIGGWGAVRGYTATRFKVTGIDRGSVTIDSKTVSSPRTIGKGDFGKLHAIWDDYCAHRIERQAITQISQNSSYIFAIFRWIEDSRPKS
jgi:hypothetical protein